MRTLQSKTLTILSTDTCTAACAHCSMNSLPTRRAKLTADQICDYVLQAKKSASIWLVIFSGGEPLLLGEDLFRSLQFVKELGLKSRLVTNGYWARTEEQAEKITTRLRESGLDEINISIDDYHIPYIDPQNVRRAFKAAIELDFESVIIAHATGPTTKFNAKELDELLGVSLPRLYDENAERVGFPEPGDKTYVAVANTTLQYIGRSLTTLTPADIGFTLNWDKRGREIGGCPWALRSPAVSPSGHLLACCGFEVAGNEILDLGDLLKESLETLLDGADNDLVLNMIAFDGPYRIMDFLKEVDPGLPFRDRYSTFCELCQHMVTDTTIRNSLLSNMGKRAGDIIAQREKLTREAEEDQEFEEMYHASDPVLALVGSQ